MALSRKSAGRLRPFALDTSVEEPLPTLAQSPHLLIRDRPFPDENLTSWLVRLAWLNGLKLYTFKYLFWQKTGNPWGRNLGAAFPPECTSRLSDLTGLSVAKIEALMIATYTGTLFESVGIKGHCNWILSVRNKGQIWHGHGQQLCPLCMSEGTPYFRKYWRVSLLVGCVYHRCLYIDRCPQCNNGISYHQGDFGRRDISAQSPTSYCPHCSFRWEAAQTLSPETCTNDFWKLQKQISDALCKGWTRGPDNKVIMALSFFEGLRPLIRILTSNNRNSRLRDYIAAQHNEIPLTIQYASRPSQFDSLDLCERLTILRYLAWLLADWPTRFIETCKQARLAFSYIDAYRKPLPFWLEQAAYFTRDPRRYPISNEEKESVRRYLERYSLPASNNEINRRLGRWYVARSKATL